jgi:anti-sigma regulatory factor (Ser/Thr protein kinase)
MDFFHVLGFEDEPAAARLPPAGRFVELRRIASETIAEETARACEALLREQLPSLASSLRRYARSVIEELGVNIVQHSNAPETGFAMAQAWGGDSPRLQIAAADAGVGFLTSLQRNLEFAGRVEEDGDALQLALTKGLTSTDGTQNSGFGLEMLRNLADVLGADLLIASGEAMLVRRTIAGQRTTVIRRVGPWRGAWISLDAPLSKLPA